MKFRIISDIHAEFSNGQFDLPVMEDEKDQVLLLAGDLGVADRARSYVYILEEMCNRFQDVLYINGNHEHYKSSLYRTTDKIHRNVVAEIGDIATNSMPDNLHYGDKYTVTYVDGDDKVAVICATLWTNMNNSDPACIMEAEGLMNDYRVIRHGPTGTPYQWKLRAVHTMFEYNMAREYIMEQLTTYQNMGYRCVVMTHHAPSFQSIAPHYVNTLSGAYASELYNPYTGDPQPVLHVHGHVHDSFDYELGDCRIVCNPRGYWRDDLNPNFNPELVIEV